MPSFNQQPLTSKVLSGNNVVIFVGGQVIGFGQSAPTSIDFGAEQFYGIGSSMPQETQQLRVAPEITLTSFALTSAGIASLGETTPWIQVLSNTEMDIQLVDASGNTIVTYIACTARSYSSNLTVNQPVTEDTAFMALDVQGPNGQSVFTATGAYAFSLNASTAGGVSVTV